MKKLCVIILILVFLFSCFTINILPVQAIGASWLPGYTYREPFSVSSNDTKTDFQASLNITYQVGMQLDFEDLRITTSDGLTFLPIWNNSQINNLWCNVWAKFPTLNIIYYLYFGNNGASNVWNQTAVFVDVITGVVGAWNMDETSGQNVADSSGNGNDGTATGTTVVDGKFTGTKARQFDSTIADRIDCTNDADLNPIALTVMAWIKSNKAGDVISRWGAGGTAYTLRLEANLNFRLYATTSGGVKVEESNNVVADSTWHFIVGTIDGTNLNLYRDGIADCNPANGVGNIITSTESTFLGNSVTAGYFNGTMDEAKVFNVALSLTQIGNIYNNYGDITLEAGKVLVRKYVYPVPLVAFWGLETYVAPTTNTQNEGLDIILYVFMVIILIVTAILSLKIWSGIGLIGGLLGSVFTYLCFSTSNLILNTTYDQAAQIFVNQIYSIEFFNWLPLVLAILNFICVVKSKH